MNFGDALKIHRKKRNLKQEDFAKELGIDRSTYANYENNVRFPSREVLFKIIENLEISVDALLTGRTLDEHRKEKRASYKIPVLNNLSIKKGSLSWDNISSYRYISLPALKYVEDEFENRDFFYYTVSEDINCIIRANSEILFRVVHDNETSNGNFVAALIDNEHVIIGKLEYFDNIIILSMHNNMHNAIVFKNADMDTIKILAEAVEVVYSLEM